MTSIRFPEVLQRVTKLGTTELSYDAWDVHDILNKCCADCSDLRNHIFYSNGQLKDHFIVTVDGNLASLDTKLGDQSTVEMMTAISEGIQHQRTLTKDDVSRYARHLMVPQIGRQGQEHLLNSRVLIVGTGGLGSPSALYLAAAGIGQIGLIDFDVVELSNLQRQVLHTASSVGQQKVDSAKERLLALNDSIQVTTYSQPFSQDNAFDIVSEYDLVIDGSDNFSTRYLLNDVCVGLNKPLVYGAISQFNGETTIFGFQDGPCYRCLFPAPPPPELAPNCNAAGVLGVLPGTIGLLQATEAIKALLKMGRSLSGRLLRYDALEMNFRELQFTRRAGCLCEDRRALLDSAGDVPQPVSCELATADPDLKPVPTVSVRELHAQLRNKFASELPIVIDVREPGELEISRLQEAINIPLRDLADHLDRLDPGETYYLLCKSGRRATAAANEMMDKGFSSVSVVGGGINAWAASIDNDLVAY